MWCYSKGIVLISCHFNNTFTNAINEIFQISQIQAEDQSFTAHRIVLAATIPYFKAMFTHNMVESKMQEISIQGIDAV